MKDIFCKGPSGIYYIPHKNELVIMIKVSAKFKNNPTMYATEFENTCFDPHAFVCGDEILIEKFNKETARYYFITSLLNKYKTKLSIKE